MGPGSYVKVEAADRSENTLGVPAWCSIGFGTQPFFPSGCLGLRQVDRVDAGVGVFDRFPEQLDEVSARSVQAGEVLAGGDLGEVGNQKASHAGRSDVEPVDEFGGTQRLGDEIVPQIISFVGE
jgi:hypothetical protein